MEVCDVETKVFVTCDLGLGLTLLVLAVFI